MTERGALVQQAEKEGAVASLLVSKAWWCQPGPFCRDRDQPAADVFGAGG